MTNPGEEDIPEDAEELKNAINPDLESHKNIFRFTDAAKIPIESERKDGRKTRNFMTKYELARILGYRAMQISQGSRILVNCSGLDDALSIAEKELKEGVLPIIIRRYLPDGSYEDFCADELSTELLFD